MYQGGDGDDGGGGGCNDFPTSRFWLVAFREYSMNNIIVNIVRIK